MTVIFSKFPQRIQNNIIILHIILQNIIVQIIRIIIIIQINIIIRITCTKKSD